MITSLSKVKKMKQFKCLTFLLFVFAFTLVTSLVKGQSREIQKEDRYFYYDTSGKKKYISNSKTQKMWTEILELCPDAIKVAQEYNVNIYQNKYYESNKSKSGKTAKIKWRQLKSGSQAASFMYFIQDDSKVSPMDYKDIIELQY